MSSFLALIPMTNQQPFKQPTPPSLDFLSIQQASKQAIQQRTQQASKEANCSATKQASQCYPASKQTSSSDQQSSSD